MSTHASEDMMMTVGIGKVQRNHLMQAMVKDRSVLRGRFLSSLVLVLEQAMCFDLAGFKCQGASIRRTNARTEARSQIRQNINFLRRLASHPDLLCQMRTRLE